MRYHQQQWMNLSVSPVVWLVLPALWVLGIWKLVNVMVTKSALDVKKAMQIYNVVQIVVCGYMVWGLLPCIGFPNVFGLNSEFDERGEWFVFVHYLSKYLDWFDTLWIVVNKKRAQLSFLHIYHHATIVPVWGMLLYCGVGNGTCRYGAWINSLTHVIMYTHYLWTSLGLKNPFKRYITMWQMTQFYSCILHAFVVFFFEYSDVQSYAWMQVAYQSTMVYLFGFKMSWVPSCIPKFDASDGQLTPVSCGDLAPRLLGNRKPSKEDKGTTRAKSAGDGSESSDAGAKNATVRSRGRAASPGASVRGSAHKDATPIDVKKAE